MRFLPHVIALLFSLQLFANAPKGNMNSFMETAFTPNMGQVVDQNGEPVSDVLTKATVPGMDLYITKTGVTYVLLQYQEDLEAKPHPVYSNEKKYKVNYSRIDVELVGAQLSTSQLNFFGEEDWKTNYYKTANGKGQESVSHFKTLKVTNVYPGIDWLWKYNAEGKLEYDFVVHAGSNASVIKMRYNYADLKTENNNLVISGKNGSITEGPLQASSNQQPVQIKYGYHASEKEITFVPSNYNHSKELIIDPPLTLNWSAQFGGSFQNGLRGVSSDNNGFAYLTGYTNSPNFPTHNSSLAYFDGTFNGQSDAIILKLDTLQTLKWATFFGGPGSDFGNSIDALGPDIFVTGGAQSGFPILSGGSGAYNQTSATGQDAFIARFDPTFLSLEWSTFYGGNGTDEGLKVFTHTSYPRGIWVSGYTNSTGGTFPTVIGGNYNQSTVTGNEAFIIQIYSFYNSVIWATTYGGNGDDYATSMAADSLNNLIVGGFTTSTNFPVLNGGHGYFQGANAGSNDGFILSFNGAMRSSATYYGGRSNDYILDATSGLNGGFVFTGRTNSTNFPVDSIGGFGYNQMHIADSTSSDAFIIKCDNNLSVNWSTYYGGKAMDVGTGVATDTKGRIYLSGFTASTDFPIDSFAGAYNQSTNHGNVDGFLARFSNQGDRSWSTYKGDSCFEYPNDIAYDTRFNKFYIAGEGLLACTGSANNGGQSLPDTGQVNSGGISSVGFCWSFNGQSSSTGCTNFEVQAVSSVNPCPGQCNGIGVVNLVGGTPPYQVVWTDGSNSPSADSALCEGDNWIEVHDSHGCKNDAEFLMLPLTLSLTEDHLNCYQHLITANLIGGNGGGLPGIVYYWSNNFGMGSYENNITVTDPGDYSVTITDNVACSITASIHIDYYNTIITDFDITVVQYPTCNTTGTVTLSLPPSYAGNIYWMDYFGTSTIAQGITASNLGAGSYLIIDSLCCYNGFPVKRWFNLSSAVDAVTLSTTNLTDCSITPNGTATVTFTNSDAQRNDNSTWAVLTGPNPAPSVSYAWSNGDVGSSADSLGVGTITVTATDGGGCTATATANINAASNSPAATWRNNPTTCYGGATGSIMLRNITGGGTPYRYFWSNGDTASSISNLPAGPYAVTVTSVDGCTISYAFQLSYNRSNSILLNAFSLPGACNPNNISVRPASSSNITTIYRWSNGVRDTFANFKPDTLYNLSAGTYTVTVTHGNTDSACLVVGVSDTLTVDIQTNAYNCNTGNSAQAIPTGGTIPISFLWSTGDTVATIHTPYSGTAWVRITDHAGCIATDTQLVHVVAPLAITNSSSIIKCNGDSATETFNATGGFTPYTGTGAYSYPAGTFVHLVTDSTGCIARDTLHISQPTPINVTANVLDTFNCLLSTVHVQVSASGGTPPYTGTGTQSFTSAGQTLLSVTDNNGCLASLPINILINPDSVFSYAQIDSVCSAGQITLAAVGVTNFSWYPAGVSDSLYTVAQVNADSTVYLTGTGNNGCTTVDTFHLMLKSCVATQSFTPESLTLSLYPNPATDICYLQLSKPASQTGQIEIFTTEGKLIGTNLIKQGEQRKEIDCSKLASAMYVIHAHIEEQDVYFKVVVDNVK